MNKYLLTYKIFLLFALTAFFTGCEPDHETVEVSHISKLPEFEYIGGQFISFVKGSQASFTDPGVIAWVDDEEVRVITLRPESIDLDDAGVYIYYYFAQNNDGLIAEGKRIIAITNEDVSENDLSGKYLTSTQYGWTSVTSKVRKKNDNGWYSCSEVMGYPGVEIKGEFVDIGGGELYLLPGESDFGDYDLSDGNYTLTSLSWSVILIDAPYYGLEIPITLYKSDE